MRERRRVLVVASTAVFCSGLVWFNYSAVLPLIVEEWGLSGTQAGVVFGALQAGYLLAVLPAGWLVDRYSSRWVIAAGATGTGVSSLAFAVFATGFLGGAGFRFLAGLCLAGVYVPGMRFLSDWFPEGVRGRALGLYVGALELGNGLSFVFATVAADVVDWRSAVVATSVGAIVIGPLVVGTTRDHPNQRGATTSGTGTSLLRDREFLSAVSIYSWHNWELFGVRNWLVAFLAVAPAFATASSVAPGIVVGAMVITGALGNGFGGWLSDRIGRLRTISIGLGASGLLSALFGRFGGLPFAVLVAVTLVYGVVLAVDSAPTSTLVTEVVGDDRVGRALSIQSLVGFSTTVVSPVVFGIALERAGYSAAFLTLAAGAVLGVVSVGALLRIRGPRP